MNSTQSTSYITKVHKANFCSYFKYISIMYSSTASF